MNAVCYDYMYLSLPFLSLFTVLLTHFLFPKFPSYVECECKCKYVFIYVCVCRCYSYSYTGCVFMINMAMPSLKSNVL